ncbi:MAG: FixH family protein [Anaerolineae bacterium]|nr:FixH family protein [Anaerolineae bacterium]
MRVRAAAVMILLTVVGLAAIWRLTQPSADSTIHLYLTSDPFPLATGPGTLMVALTRADGAPVTDADVQVSASMMMPGMMPVIGRLEASRDGQYPVSVMWTMPGEWVLDITAAAPGSESVHEQYNVYIYPVPIPPPVVGGEARYHSVREVEADVSTNPAKEMWIVIPLGTQQMMRTGQGADIVPYQIHLSLNGQNTLVIRNDDIADHTIGPFFVRAGETVRQQFTRAAEYVGKCTISHGAEVSIIVE